MWSQFYLVALFIVLTLLVPGYLTLRAFGMPRAWAACCAPVVSMALLSAWGQLLAFAHVAATPVLALAPLVVTPLVAALVASKRVPELSMPSLVAWLPLVFLAFGLSLGYLFYISRMPTPDSIYQAYDVTQHLNLIQAMTDSGRLSSLGVSPYLTAADVVIDPTPNPAFYPASWHALCAVTAQATAVSTPLVINASMFAFLAVVYPLAMCAFLAAAFDGERRTVAFGAVVTLAFVMFPWALVIFGPVYPNVAGFCAMPVALALFVRLVSADAHPSERARLGALVVISALGLALLHPNTIFSCAALLVPHCLGRIWDACRARGLSKPRALACCTAFALACCAAWYGAYRLPFFAGTVSHVWKPYARPFQQLINILSQTYTMMFWAEVAVQWALAPLVIAGFIRALHMPGRRWLAGSYTLVASIFLYNGTQQGALRQIIGGFWYTDPMRLAALCCIAATPLAALGLEWAFLIARDLLTTYNVRLRRPTSSRRVAIALVACFLFLNFMPGFNLPGQHYLMTPAELEPNKNKEPRDYTKTFHTTFGDYREAATSTYTFDTALDARERAFLRHVKHITGTDLVLNDPMDGSFLGYGYNDTHMYYRNFTGVGDSKETEASRLIRTRLSSYATDASVREAVASTGARYVLVLDQTGSEAEGSVINLRGDYDASKFAGVSSVTPDTPGFTLIFQQGNLYLYEINK